MSKKQLMKNVADTVMGDYRLDHLLGRGDHADVWSASSIRDSEIVAMKLMDETEATQCYVAALSVDNVAIVRPKTMFNVGQIGVIVMPLCPGRSVEGLSGYVNERQAWMLLRDIASALAALHSAGMAHGNICAENILYDGGRYKLTGFSSCQTTANGGRPDNDVWQLGATVFHLCMGCHVFNGMGMKAQKPLSPLPYMRKSMPRLSTIVQQCLAYGRRLTAQQIADVADQELQNMNRRQGTSRQQRTDRQPMRRLKEDFWPNEMRRIIVMVAMAFATITGVTAQTISDQELSNLVDIVINLRNDSPETYDRVKTLLQSDEQWTPMTELGPLKENECKASEKMQRFKLNSILTLVDNERNPATTHGDGLNGEDTRYKYSLYERALKATKSVSYEMTGRVGAQIFVIVPYAGVKAKLSAELTIGSATIKFLQNTNNGLLVADYPGRLTKDDVFNLTVINGSTKNQSFIIINYNTREL